MKTNGNKGNLNCCFKHVCTFIILSLILLVPGFTLAEDFTVTTIGNHGDITIMEGAENYDAENPDDSPNAGSWHENHYRPALAVNAVLKASVDPDLSISGKSILLVPPAPLLSYPTISGFPLNMRTDRTPIAGIAEPASMVQLFKKGLLVGEATALEKDLIQSFIVGYEADEPSLSPDGKTLAYMTYDPVIDEYFIWLQDLATGNATEIASKAGFPLWSPDGTMLAYVFYDENWNIKISIYDMDTGVSTPLTDDTDVNEYLPSWSSDGNNIAFVSTRGDRDDIWIKDLSSGSMTRVTDGLGFANDLDLSPDAAKLAYVRGETLSVVDLLSGAISKIDYDTDEGTLDWSPESKRLAFVSFSSGSAEVFIYDTETKSINQVTHSGEDKLWPHWSPDGRQIVYGARGAVGDEVWLLPLDGQGEARMLRRVDPDDSLNYLTWTGWGGIGYISDETLEVSYLAGHFAFDTVLLDAGQNTFHATATDDSGNTGPQSDEITLILDPNLLPDLETLPEDISISPDLLVEGEEASISVLFRNNSAMEAKDVDVHIFLWDATGIMELVESKTFPFVDAHSEEMIGFTWDTTGKAGKNTVMVILDADNTIHEISEENNLATREFSIAEDEGFTLTVGIDSNQYSSNEDVNIHIDLHNGGPEIEGVLDVRVEDENGVEVAVIDTITLRLPYGSTRDYDHIWNTGITYAGDYRVRATFRTLTDIIAEGITPFTILPTIDVESSVVTDKALYGPNEDVLVTVEVKNNGQNYNIPLLDVKVKITGDGYGELFSEDREIVNLLAGTSASLSSTWNTGLTAPGDYRADIEVLLTGEMVSSSSAGFGIDASVILTGTITVTPPEVNLGDAVRADYTVSNSGNAAAMGLVVRTIVLDPEDQAVMASSEEVIDLNVGETHTGQSTFSTDNLSLKSYNVLLQAIHLDETENIASDSFSVRDGTPPIVSIISPTPGSTINEAFDLAVRATDNASGVYKVEYQIDGGEWKKLTLSDPATGTYSTTLEPTEADEGPHTIIFQATDEARNVSSPVSTSITIVPRVDMTTTLDAEQYGMNANLHVHVHLANVGWGKAVALDVAIKDTGGETVVSFDPITTTLGPNATQGYDFTWNTGETYAGAYHIYAVLTRAGDTLNENTVDFTILPVMVIDSRVTTDNDKTHYSMNEDVFAMMEVTNNGNAIASELDVKLTISQEGGSNLFSEDLTITDLTPGAQVGLGSTWNTGQNPAGEYLARMEVYHAGNLVSEGQAAFVIDPLVIITGTLEVTPTEVALGEAVGTNYAVRNSGNTAADGLFVKVLVRNQETQAVVAEQQQALALGINATGTGTFTFSTGGYDLGPYAVLLQYLWEGVTHDLAQGLFTVIDPNPPQVTIISPEGGQTYDGPFELTVTATDDASGVEKVEYQIDGGEWKALLLSNPATDKYSTTWEPTVEDEGPLTIRFRATDNAGNTSTPVSVSIAIEFNSPFDSLTGTISAVPDPVSYGCEVSFIYSIKNDTTNAIEDLTVRVLITDPNTDPNAGEIKKTLERTVTVPKKGSATGNLNASTLELGPGDYAAKLQVASAKASEPRILAHTRFEVVSSLEVTESMADPVNLLVWVNDGCHHKSHHQGIGEDEDDFDDYGHDIDGDNVDDGQRDDSGFEGNDNLEEAEGKEHIGLQCAPSKRCIRKDLIEAILAGTVDDYLIVYKGRDFEKELRNPYHTDILILGDHKPLTDHFVEELREKVYSGMGIISSLWLKKGWGKYPYHYYRYYHRYDPIFGVMYKGGMSGRYHTITTVPSQITEEDTIEAEGKALMVEALEDTAIAGWIKRKKGWKHGYDPQYYPHPRRHPAIVLNEYGLGKAIYFAFDIGLTLTDDNEDQISELIENAISHVHRTPEAENFLPNQLIPYEVTVKALGAGFDVRITETFPEELDLYNPATGEWITESPWTLTMHLEPNGVGTIRYYMLTPDAAGTYTIETEVGFVHEEDYIFFQKSSTEIVVEMDSSALVANIIAELDSLSASKWDRHKVRMAIKYMEKVGQWEIVEVGDIDWNIHNILKAIDCLFKVKSHDIAEIRLMLDDLLRVEQGMYFYFVPVF